MVKIFGIYYIHSIRKEEYFGILDEKDFFNTFDSYPKNYIEFKCFVPLQIVTGVSYIHHWDKTRSKNINTF